MSEWVETEGELPIIEAPRCTGLGLGRWFVRGCGSFDSLSEAEDYAKSVAVKNGYLSYRVYFGNDRTSLYRYLGDDEWQYDGAASGNGSGDFDDDFMEALAEL